MTRKEELISEYNKLNNKRANLIIKRDTIIHKLISTKVIVLHTLGVIPVCIIDAIIGTFPLFSLLYSVAGPVIYTFSKNNKIKKLNNEISRITNDELFPVTEELDKIVEKERQEKQKKTDKKDRFVEALKKPMPAKIQNVLDKRVDHIPGTDKVRTFASGVPGLYSSESDMKNVISNRDNAFTERKEAFALSKRIRR